MHRFVPQVNNLAKSLQPQNAGKPQGEAPLSRALLYQ